MLRVLCDAFKSAQGGEKDKIERIMIVKTIGEHKMERVFQEKIYAGWLGKVIGVRHGANTEGWSYDDLLHTFGEITYYPHDFPKNFCTDDDLNGPLFFMRALEDCGFHEDITPAEMGNTIMNYLQQYKGFFWWGGYGVSTEHTAYENMKSGIPAPFSGSIAQNGHTIAEQIGGQIFSDCWGFIFPGEPEKAADYAERMASVTHDGNGLYGARFVAGAIASAFVESGIPKVINRALSLIPVDCMYQQVFRAIEAFHDEHPENWRSCFLFLKKNYGYDKFPGSCHIIPNAGVIALALYYGNGDFSRTINIANMCGWDTDCNVGNAAAILGVFVGVDGIADHWRAPIRDFLAASSVLGSRNIEDIPHIADYTCYLADKMAGRETEYIPEHRISFDYPGSIQAFRAQEDIVLCNTDEVACTGNRSLRIAIQHPLDGKHYDVYYQTDYNNTDFNDSRYNPSFSPILYGGQTVSAVLRGFHNHKLNVSIVVKARSGDEWTSDPILLLPNEWRRTSFTLPALADQTLLYCGIRITPVDMKTFNCAVCYLDDFSFGGTPNYTNTFAREEEHRWTPEHFTINQFVVYRGNWKLEDHHLHMNADRDGAAIYTGDCNFRNYKLTTVFTPISGFCDSTFGVVVRCNGNRIGYAISASRDTLAIDKWSLSGTVRLGEVPFKMMYNETYTLTVDCYESTIQANVRGVSLTVSDPGYSTGCFGFINQGGGHQHILRYTLSAADDSLTI